MNDQEDVDIIVFYVGDYNSNIEYLHKEYKGVSNRNNFVTIQNDSGNYTMLAPEEYLTLAQKRLRTINDLVDG